MIWPRPEELSHGSSRDVFSRTIEILPLLFWDFNIVNRLGLRNTERWEGKRDKKRGANGGFGSMTTTTIIVITIHRFHLGGTFLLLEERGPRRYYELVYML